MQEKFTLKLKFPKQNNLTLELKFGQSFKIFSFPDNFFAVRENHSKIKCGLLVIHLMTNGSAE